MVDTGEADGLEDLYRVQIAPIVGEEAKKRIEMYSDPEAVSYTHLRAHETS